MGMTVNNDNACKIKKTLVIIRSNIGNYVQWE